MLSRLGERLAETLAVVISKSGGTPETRNGMLEATAAYAARGLDFAKHAVAITQEGSALDEQAVAQAFLARFPMWDWVGGRTSVTSAVGLLPAALQGIDTSALLAGRRGDGRGDASAGAAREPGGAPRRRVARAGNGRGAKDMVVLPYKDRLLLFSRYLQQLVMESLGKEKDLAGRVVHQGLAVYGNKGSTDQHAFVQQLRDGAADFFVTFVRVLRDRDGGSVEVEPGATSGDFLDGFLLGTRRALFESGRPSITITIPEVSPRTLGMLIALYERTVGLYASLVDDQRLPPARRRGGEEGGGGGARPAAARGGRAPWRGRLGRHVRGDRRGGGRPGGGRDGLPPARAPRREPRSAASPAGPAGRRSTPSTRCAEPRPRPARAPVASPATTTVRVGNAIEVPASSTIRRMPRSASWRRRRNSSKSVGREPAEHLDVERRRRERGEARDDDVGPHPRHAPQQLLDPVDHLPNLLLGRAVREADRGREPDPVARGRSPRSASRRACRSAA